LDKRFSPEQVEFAFKECLLDLIGKLTFANFIDAVWE
jgi:hypothetical protein